MNAPDASKLYRVLDATWAAARQFRVGPWMIRQGLDGGKRVSAATAEATYSDADIETAEFEMAKLGQQSLFMIRDGDEKLDQDLADKGYRIVDPVALYSAPLSALTATPIPKVSGFHIWPPLAIINEIWSRQGIGAGRQAVMERTNGPKTTILARDSDQPAGAGFVAIYDNIAMIHAIEVVPHLRRRGVGANILRVAGHWAQDQGATHLALAVTCANDPANQLYSSQGMTVVGHYHYRIK